MKYILFILSLIVVRSEMLTANQFEVLEIFPPKQTSLVVQDKAYIRIRYQSAEPTRFVVKAFKEGKEIESLFRSNPQPLYPKGEGEALAWVKMAGPSQIETILVQSFNSNWKKLGEREIFVQWPWVETFLTKNNRTQPFWVDKLQAIQNQMMRDQIESSGRQERFLQAHILDTLYFLLFLYVLLQVYVASSMKGSLRRRILVPLALFVPATLYSALAYFGSSDLWPMAFLFAAPLALFYLCGLVFWEKRANP